MNQSDKSIGEVIRIAEKDYINGTTTISKYVDASMSEEISTIGAYLNSKHISGEQDSQGRDKPFFNIVTAAVNIWYRATDIDRKDIRFKATKASDYLLSFLATAKLQEWMRKSLFGQFLNKWGLSLARYGSSVLEFIEANGELNMSVLSWNNLIVDSVDFNANPLVKILYLTPAELRKKKEYDQELVEKLIESSAESRETLDRQKKDNKNNYIKIYEIHGELEKSYLTGKESDDGEYVQQMQVVSCVSKEKGKYDDFVLYNGKEKKSHMITHLIEAEGMTLSMGAVKHLFQAQWMVNHSEKNTKDYLDAISKVIYQTADPNYANKNVLNDIEHGFIAVYDATKAPSGLTQIQHSTSDITAFQNFATRWQNLAQEISSTPDILQGKSLPSGTAYRQAAIIQQESHSNFEIMVENKGMYIEQMMRDFIIPYLKKQLNTKEEVVATLEDYGIEELDRAFIPREAAKRFNRKAVEAVLNDSELPNYEQEIGQVTQELNTGVRFFKPDEADKETWKDILDGFDWDSLEVDVTGEQGDKNTILTTLSTILQTIATNPMILQNPDAKMIFNEILEISGNVSPIKFKKPAMPMAQPPQVGAGVGADINFQQ